MLFYSSSKEPQNQTQINLGKIFNHVANKYEKEKKKWPLYQCSKLSMNTVEPIVTGWSEIIDNSN